MVIKHTMKLQSEPFDKIKNGSKIIESRLYDKKRQILQLDDVITFCRVSDNEEQITARITALLRYPSFQQLFSDFPSDWFGGSSKKELSDEIQQFYSEDDEKKAGVLGIKIQYIE